MLRNVLNTVINGAVRTPLILYVYLAVVIYIYRRMARDFLGIGTKRTTILGRTTVDLSKEEEILSARVVDPATIPVSFRHVGGLVNEKATLTENVVWPLSRPDLFPVGSLRSPPTGVLLYGPPGTGKTLLAKALAKEVNAYFIEISVDQLFSRYVGDSEKLCAAVFSLATKLKTAVIFIDEIDTFLSERNGNDNAVYSHAKSIFMTKWDGLTTDSTARIIVVGATNRAQDLDDAILRRLSLRIHIPFPSQPSREAILRILLENEPQFQAVADAEARQALICQVSELTHGFSGSDLRELCKVACTISLREMMTAQSDGQSAPAARPLSRDAFRQALERVTATQWFEPQ